ncbi:DUF6069 family protein [Cryptosporangium phraense]|uniref:Uncharacterized protein n=1 Tax=Cryptosporangium phraense TaxID=2593070 RepID=A0A545AWB4_9ACTN|nr:DUF6069 family protein [Cryptosporangium phraense]TQS45614.1 hypothetical protein FL583_07745 [Cryptosporangium phraense]
MSRSILSRSAAVGAAALSALVLFAASGAHPMVGEPAQAVDAGAVLVTSVLAGLAGWAVLAILERTTKRAFRNWTVVSIAVFALSLLGPLGSAADTHSTWVLVALHFVVFGVLYAGLARTARARDCAQVNVPQRAKPLV